MTRKTSITVIAMLILIGFIANSSFAQEPIGEGAFYVLGLGLSSDPSQQTVPINTDTVVNTNLLFPDIPELSHANIPSIPLDFIVVAELTGPGISKPITIKAGPGEQLMIPPLPQKGTYVLDKIRLMSGDQVLLYAEPSMALIDTIEKLLITQVTSRPLSIDEIESLGIRINPENFTAYNFTVGFATESGPVKMQLPVVIDSRDRAIEPRMAAGKNISIRLRLHS